MWMQTLMFVNNDTVSKGMVKYASNLAKESIVDVTGKVYVPKEPVQGCSQSQASSLTLHTAAACALHCRFQCGCDHAQTDHCRASGQPVKSA